MTTLLIADHDNRSLGEATARALTAAAALGEAVDILVAGDGCADVAAAASRLAGIRKVILAESEALAHRLAEPVAALVVHLAPGYDALVAAATAAGKNTMPRIAALLDVMQVSDIVRVVLPDTFERPIYAGNAVETVQSADRIRVLTVRASAFAPAAIAGGAAPVERIAVPALPEGGSRFVAANLTQSERPELTGARIVISGGRAFQSAENFRKYLEPVANRLRAIGASRGRRCRLRAERPAGGPDRQDRRARPLHRLCISAPSSIRRHEGRYVIVAINKDAGRRSSPSPTMPRRGVFEIPPELERRWGASVAGRPCPFSFA